MMTVDRYANVRRITEMLRKMGASTPGQVSDQRLGLSAEIDLGFEIRAGVGVDHSFFEGDRASLV